MNRILAICHSLSPEGLDGVNVFLRSLVQTFTMERFASIHILHGPAISRKDFPAEIPILRRSAPLSLITSGSVFGEHSTYAYEPEVLWDGSDYPYNHGA